MSICLTISMVYVVVGLVVGLHVAIGTEHLHAFDFLWTVIIVGSSWPLIPVILLLEP